MAEILGRVQRALGPVLAPLGAAYGGLMGLRRTLYRRGLLPAWEPGAPTVSVGNIAWGGTGKTPVAGWFLAWAEARGLDALLLTRGYRASPPTYPYLVRPEATAAEAGDEPLMLARAHPRARVVVDPQRRRGGQWAMDRFRPGLVILDDGFQHLAVRRHLDLVLLRPDDLGPDWNRVVPAGTWREAAPALARADAFLIKTGPQDFQRLLPLFQERTRRFPRPIFGFQLTPTALGQVLTGRQRPDLGGEPYLLVSGVGDPAQVEATATDYLGYGPARHLAFADHHRYTAKDVTVMRGAANALGCRAILCTPKDAVKLGPLCTPEFWRFRLRLDFGPSSLGRETTFEAWWNHRYQALAGRRPDGPGAASVAPPTKTPENDHG